MDVKQGLIDALGLTDDDFSSHATDLYVLAKPGVREWLDQNYPWPKNVSTFTAAAGTPWAGKLCYDIPFALHKATPAT
jgi:hypothetical protein